MNRLETTILTNLIHNENFSRKVLPFLKTDYFSANEEVTIFKIIESYIIKYNNLPSKEAISIELSNLKRRVNIFLKSHTDFKLTAQTKSVNHRIPT